ncbi:MAG TPA: proton-conducting transporter membrane subunit [Feifaniaceae bacterium]|nr:proton-conducting transporter membrane subunit [Feifaniaceae bacterium]
MNNILLFLILAPAAFAALLLLLPQKVKRAKEILLVGAALINLGLMLRAYGNEIAVDLPWGGFGMEFSLRLYPFSGFILLAAAIIALLVALYSAAFLRDKPCARRFYAFFLLTVALVNGAVLSNNLVLLLFFWEGILCTMFAMLLNNQPGGFKTAVKAIVIVGFTDLCLMLGIGMTAQLAGTLNMEGIRLPVNASTSAAFILMLIGALGKAGAMPFHTWIPDAADDAPLPFMAFLPGALEKLMGIYLLVRVTTGFYTLEPGSAMSTALMTLGAIGILFAVMMALIQKDYKRLLSYHAVSQVGYMLLGIGTALPVGIIGGLFHMLNNALYKSCLFLTAGAVERQAGTTDLKAVGGLRKRMPVTFACFLVAAASIAGFPLTNGFFSKELIFDAALDAAPLFYIVAAVGAFFTAVSFLKLGHAAYFGKQEAPKKDVTEAPWGMLIPMIALAAGCVLAAVFQGRLIALFKTFLPEMEHLQEAGAHTNYVLAGISAAVLALAVLSHRLGYKKTGRGISAADHFHYAPGLHQIYDLAEKKVFDPYYVFGLLGKGYCAAALAVNNGISWFYDTAVVRFTGWVSAGIRKRHTGSIAAYLVWTVLGVAFISAFLLISLP